MNKLSLMQNPELFQGELHIKKNTNYFEGWYFKHTNGKYGISFIPSVNIVDNKKYASVQVITNDNSYFIEYNFDQFKYNHDPFYIQIGENFFSKEYVHINISKDNLFIKGNITYSDITPIAKSKLSPNIMGPFSFVPFMECNHAILSMKHTLKGSININYTALDFNGGVGYIEKDWGSSFPSSYVWCQANKFLDSNASLFLSIADIPFKAFNFTGFICTFILDGKEYRFATYNRSKLLKHIITDSSLDILLKNKDISLNIITTNFNGLKLAAPNQGSMDRHIYESINASTNVTLYKDGKIIFSQNSLNCGLEISN